MVFVLGLVAWLLITPQVGVLPDVPAMPAPWEEQGNRKARRRDAKRAR